MTKIFFPEWINKAEKLYNEGLSYRKIAKELKVDRKRISFYLREKGYKSNPKYVRNIDKNKLRKYDYSYAESVFENIDSEEKAYWLGFLYADGYISQGIKNEISLSLKEEDREHLEKFRAFLKLENKKITLKKKEMNNKIYYSYRFCLSNQKIRNDLILLGCLPRKTFKLSFPNSNQVPDYLVRHFIRGYIDGDGCITNHITSKISLEILGTEQFLKGYLEKIDIKNKKIYSFNHSAIKRIVLSGKNAIYVLDDIYKDAHIFMRRKYDRYLSLRRLALKSA